MLTIFKFFFYALSVLTVVVTCASFIEGDEKNREVSTQCFGKETPKLQVRVGDGYDLLTGQVMRSAYDLDSYEKCRTTDRGQYLVPDSADVVAVRHSNYDVTSEIIDNFENYTQITSNKFGIGAKFEIPDWAVKIGGSFSNEYADIKRQSSQRNSVLIRTRWKTVTYTVRTKYDHVKLTPNLRQTLVEAMESLKDGGDERAKGLVELVIRDYGTHVINTAEAGAILLKEDFVDMIKASQRDYTKSELLSWAKVSFMDILNLDFHDSSFVKEKQTVKEYSKITTSWSLKAVGGMMYTPGLNGDEWFKSVAEHLVEVGRSGEPVSSVVSISEFPEMSEDLRKRTRELLDDAVIDYLRYNTHKGCTDPTSPNFDMAANMNDGSCDMTFDHHHNYSFGGSYQTCTNIVTQYGDLCKNELYQDNLLTGAPSCPIGYEPVPFYNGTHTVTGSKQVCTTSCKRPWWCLAICKKCTENCHTENPKSSATYKSYWCSAVDGKHSSVSRNQGVMFGGVFTNTVSNPVTGERKCAKDYQVVKFVGSNVNLCISTSYEKGYRLAVPFGGFFSCNSPNPLYHEEEPGLEPEAERLNRKKREYYSEKTTRGKTGCPSGYTQHMMTIIDKSCMLHYCTKTKVSNKRNGPHPEMLALIRPPFRKVEWDTGSIMQVSTGSVRESELIGILASMLLLFIIFILAVIFYLRKIKPGLVVVEVQQNTYEFPQAQRFNNNLKHSNVPSKVNNLTRQNSQNDYHDVLGELIKKQRECKM